MIRFLQHDMIDTARWDDCISNAVNGNLVAFSWYLNIVSPGWCALVEGDYESVFPLPVSSRNGIKYMMQPYFSQQLGLFSRALPLEDMVAVFLNNIPSEYRYIDINLNSFNRVPKAENVSEMINLELDLSGDYGTISAGYQSNLQRNLKKASQNKLQISTTVKPEELISLFRANKGQDLKNLQNDQYNLIKQIAGESISKGTGEIWGVYNENNELAAGILWVRSHQKAVFLFSALSDTGKKSNAMPWLIDLYISQHAGKSLTLDFEGSNNPGLARYYSSFGAKKVTYQRYIHNSLPYPMRLALKIWRKSRLLLNFYFPLLNH